MPPNPIAATTRLNSSVRLHSKFIERGKEMRGSKLFGFLAASMVLGGCATQKELLVTDASRADGVVTLSYESNEFQSVSYDAQRAQEMAAQRCAAWGYSGAESFGSEKTTCTSRRGFGNCGARRVDVQYQCTGSPSSR